MTRTNTRTVSGLSPIPQLFPAPDSQPTIAPDQTPRTVTTHPKEFAPRGETSPEQAEAVTRLNLLPTVTVTGRKTDLSLYLTPSEVRDVERLGEDIATGRTGR